MFGSRFQISTKWDPLAKKKHLANGIGQDVVRFKKNIFIFYVFFWGGGANCKNFLKLKGTVLLDFPIPAFS